MHISSTSANPGLPDADVAEVRGTDPCHLPHRIRLRPSPEMWSDAELMTLAEAASLFWPMGPLTTTSLRTAVRDGKLHIAEVAGKLLTNKACIAKMSVCGPRTALAEDGEDADISHHELQSPRSAAEFSRMRKAGLLKRRRPKI